MKVIKLLIGMMVAGTVSAQTTKFETTEYKNTNSLTHIKASSAYNRGYTGKNSVIAIIDSGIDTSNLQFKDKILFTKDFSGSGSLIDKIGHGTHVAGIAAANKDNTGMHGVAYDAKLLIGKVTDNGAILPVNVLNGISWAKNTGADVVNLSLGWSLTPSMLNANEIVKGIYTTKFTNTGLSPVSNLYNINELVTAMQGEMVMVVAAGNDRTKWSQGLATLATITDNKNNLLFGGRVIIAGNYDPATNNTHFTNNGAAHLCNNVVKGVMNQQYCADKFKTWEFYLLAPGSLVLSTVPKDPGIPQILENTPAYGWQPTGLARMTGTSMAAPAISGAVAIIHQMWPQMKGSNIVKLLLVTGNKNIPNYSVYVHGQGLLDLEKATSPYGAIGIPTTGRLSGPNLTNVRPLIYTGGSASTGGLTNVMMVDEFERDFYISGKNFTTTLNKPTFNPEQLSFVYQNQNPYVLFNNYNYKLTSLINDVSLNFYKDITDAYSGMVEFNYLKPFDKTNVQFTTGYFSESQTWLGNYVGSFTGDGNNKNSNTFFAGIKTDTFINEFKIYGSYITGITQTNSNSQNITKINKVYSDSWSVGAEYNYNGNHKFGFMYYKPVTVNRAMANIFAPVSLDSEFNIIQNSVVNLAATIHEKRLGVYHSLHESKKYQTMTFIETRHNYKGQQSVKDTAIGFAMKRVFH